MILAWRKLLDKGGMVGVGDWGGEAPGAADSEDVIEGDVTV